MRLGTASRSLHLDRTQYAIVVASLIYSLAFAAWVIIAPASDSLNADVNNVLGIIGPAVLSVLILVNALRPSRRHQAGGRWAPAMLGLGILLFSIGDTIWAYYEIVLSRPTPFPSIADIAYLAGYPVLMMGILTVPAGKQLIALRARVALDGSILVLVAAAVSWFLIIGPTIEAGGDTLFAVILSAAYPLGDLLLVMCLVLLWSRVTNSVLRVALQMISAGLIVVVGADSLFAYLELEGAYQTGYVFTDIGWVVGYVLICLGALVMQRQQRVTAYQWQADDASRFSSSQPRLLQMVLPYALIPFDIPILLYCWFSPQNDAREIGVLVINIAMVGIVTLRQIAAIIENSQLQRETLAYAERLEQLATTDPLTELPNHRALMSTLDQEIERAERYGRHVSILFLDLDHFKTINDSLGHPSGDAILTEVGQVISGSIRNVDTVGRWGGEEFLIILPESDRDDSETIAERVRSAIASRNFSIGGGVHMTCSIGVATFGIDAHDRDLLITLADEALYAAKRLGRNQVRSAADPATAAVIIEGTSHDPREAASLMGMIEALISLVAARDQYTSNHSLQVGMLATRIAVALGLTASEAQTIGQAGQLHDIGKVAIPDAMLRKPGTFTDDEWSIMRQHPIVSAEVISHVPALRHLVPIVRGHHERVDGAGYPDQLRGNEIPLGARILAVVDSYSAMTADRPYRPARSTAWALTELRRHSGTQFDPEVVAALERVITADPSIATPHQSHYRPASATG